MTKKDLLTGESFEATRHNQKFASAENRIKYYNNKANDLRLKTSFMNKPLLNNLRILNELMENKNERVFHIEFLLGKGYALAVFTNVEEYQGQSHYALYQYLIINVENDLIKILKKMIDYATVLPSMPALIPTSSSRMNSIKGDNNFLRNILIFVAILGIGIIIYRKYKSEKQSLEIDQV